MKKIFSTLSILAMLAVGCIKPDIPTPEPEPEPEPEPKPTLVDNTLYLLNEDGTINKEVEMVSATSFFTPNGYYAYYIADIEGLSPVGINNETIDFSTANVVAVNILYPLNGRKINLNIESLRFLLSIRMQNELELDFANHAVDENAHVGTLTFNIDREQNKSSIEIDIELKSGKKIYLKSDCNYTPGGENESIFLWGDYSRPVLAAFYDDKVAADREATLYLTSGQIEYGEDIPRTTYIRINPAKSICDGQAHDIAKCIADNTLELFLRDFESEWDIAEGEITIKVLPDHNYEVTIGSGLGVERTAGTMSKAQLVTDIYFDLYYNGEFKDKNVEREIPNVFTYDKKEYTVKSVVIDLTTEITCLYFCQGSDINTVEAAQEDNSVKVTVSRSKWTGSVGLSTDKDVFSVSFNGNLWDKTNLDTGSYIVHEYNETTGLFHCQLANLWLVSPVKNVLKLEYKGYPTIIR